MSRPTTFSMWTRMSYSCHGQRRSGDFLTSSAPPSSLPWHQIMRLSAPHGTADLQNTPITESRSGCHDERINYNELMTDKKDIIADVKSFMTNIYPMTSSNGNIFRVTGPLCGEFTGPGEFPTQRPVTRSFDVFFDLRLNKRLSEQP